MADPPSGKPGLPNPYATIAFGNRAEQSISSFGDEHKGGCVTMAEYVTISTLEGPNRDGAAFDAYVARPAQAPKAALIVIQEIFGINPGIRRKCDPWAQLGYQIGRASCRERVCQYV